MARAGGNLRRLGPVFMLGENPSIDDLSSIHALRHTFASQLVMNGVDLPTVQRLMGHTDIQTTMI